MYAIHTTPGFIVDSRPYGEADRLITIFTRDFGLITASALGIRKEASKLRYFCQDYMFGRYSLVRGKEFWRLTSASDLDAPVVSGIADVRRDTGVDRMLARIAQLLRRLLHGEESNPELYDVMKETATFASAVPLSEEGLKNLESISVLRIMYLLGYVGNDKMLEPYLSHTELSAELVADAGKHRNAINLHINKALKESHL
ncbi:MAG TPA: DNA repair protein RecO, partial [Candidatus Paceibacterota bacterium]